jgi:uncharacterized protein
VRKIVTLLIFLLLSSLCWANGELEIDPEEYRLIEWMDLISPAEAQYYAEVQEGTDKDPAYVHPGPIPESAFNPELSGIKIKLAGFIVGVDSDPNNFKKVRSFLFVPWQGACIHVPPPPPNQTIYVESEKSIESNPYEPFYLYGTLVVGEGNNEQAVFFYTLQLDGIELMEHH